MASKVNVGIVGTGNIFHAYAKGLRRFRILDLVACADIDRALAEARAAEHDIPRVCAVEDLLNDPGIDIVVNLTPPKAHAIVSMAAIEAGKHVYSEKPLGVTRQEGARIVAAAAEHGVLVGCAPDTFLGGGQQTARKLLDDGWIGTPVAATAFFMGHGPEAWHPNPFFFYQKGGGPMLDLGPYYVTALVNLLGPIARVTASARISFPERIATSEVHFGKRIPVDIPTHVAGVADFASGAIGTLITSFDVWTSTLPHIEIYGSEGSLSVPDPNIFGGPVRVRRAGASEWTVAPHSHSTDVGRGIGVADLAYAITSGRKHRAGGDLAYHVLDVMQAFGEASEQGVHVAIESRCERPAALPLGLLPGTLD